MNKYYGRVLKLSSKNTAKIIIFFKHWYCKYRNLVSHWKKCLAHFNNNIVQVGDYVLIEKSLKISKNKSWLIKHVFGHTQTKIYDPTIYQNTNCR